MKRLRWFYPGLKLKRWLMLVIIGVLIISVGLGIVAGFDRISLIKDKVSDIAYFLTGSYTFTINRVIGFIIISLGLCFIWRGVRGIIISLYKSLLPHEDAQLLDVLYHNQKLKRGPKIVVIGGGTGLSTMLRGIKKLTENITAIVTVADDGGSSGVLREELGTLPPGDIRNCLVALADREPLMERLFQYRFDEGDKLKGHSFGNLFIAAMSEVLGDFEQAVKESSKVLAVKGQVLPSTLEDVRLSARLENGELIKGESQIPKIDGKISEVFIDPEDSEPLPEALEAIQEADAIVLGPGSLYTSLLPNLLLEELSKTVKESSALKIYICNVMTQAGETDDYTAADHVQALYDHVGSEILDYVLVNNKRVDPSLLDKYAQEGARPVEVDLKRLNEQGVEVIQASLINQSDLVRHNSDKLARLIVDLIIKEKNKD